MKEEKASKELLRGFNNGYILSKHRPDIADSIARAFAQSLDDYSFGFRDGVDQWKKEREKPKTRNYTLTKHEKTSLATRKDRSKDKDMDRTI